MELCDILLTQNKHVASCNYQNFFKLRKKNPIINKAQIIQWFLFHTPYCHLTQNLLDEKRNLKVERKHSMSVHKPNFSEFQNIRKNIKSSEVEIYGSLMPGANQFITQAYPCPVHILLFFVTSWNASVPSHRIHFTHNCCSISGTQSVKSAKCMRLHIYDYSQN